MEQTRRAHASVRVQSLKAGIPFARACKLSGISESTGHNWRRAGWAEIENEDEDSTADIPFIVRFALETELALGEFMRPLIERMREGGTGKKGGDWRSAAALLASRFPDEFSEKTHVAKSQRVEVSGHLSVGHAAAFQQFMSFRNMDRAELLVAMEKLGNQINFAPIPVDKLPAHISHLEGKAAAMREALDANHDFMPGNWVQMPMQGRPKAIEAHEYSDAAPGPAPSEPSASAVIPHSALGSHPIEKSPVSPTSPAPASPGVMTGITYSRDGLAIPITDGKNPFNPDEDLSL